MPTAFPSLHPATAWVDLDRIRENFRALQAYSGERVLIPVLKADAYGHGAAAVARALEPLGPSLFAVAYVDEAIALRRQGVNARLLVLTGFAPSQVGDIIRFGLTPVVSTPEQVSALETEMTRGGDAPEDVAIHLKVDTGMSRLGFSVMEIEPVVHRLEDLQGIRLEGLMTHLASADESPSETAEQLDLFDEALFRLETLGARPPLIHAANSAGLAAMRRTHTAARPGLLVYGLAPRPLSPEVNVRPAMEVLARVALVKTVAPGKPVSYGGKFVTERLSRIATLNAGYADGVPRTDRMRLEGALAWRGSALKVAGAVCMDLTMVDASDAPDLNVGDEVTILGEAPTAWDLAAWAGTNAWQILTSVGPRLPRRYKLGGVIVDAHLNPQS